MQFGTFNNTDTCHTLRYFHSTKQCAEILYYNTYVVFFLKMNQNQREVCHNTKQMVNKIGLTVKINALSINYI